MSDSKTKNYAKKTAADYNILTRLYQLYAMHVVFPIFLGLFYKFIFKGQENVNKNANYIVSPNHISYFDPFLAAIATGKPLGFMAKKELFENSAYVAKNICRLGAFAVNREKLEKSTLKSAREILKTKWDLCIFPQGGIRKNKKIEEVNQGFIFFAKSSKRDILPMGISGVESYNWSIFKRPKVYVTIGKPIPYEADENEIVKNWQKQVSEMTGYELVQKEFAENKN